MHSERGGQRQYVRCQRAGRLLREMLERAREREAMVDGTEEVRVMALDVRRGCCSQEGEGRMGGSTSGS